MITDSDGENAILEGYYLQTKASALSSGEIDLTIDPTNPWNGHLVPISTDATAKQTYYLSSLCNQSIWKNITEDNFFYKVSSKVVSANSGGAPGNVAKATFIPPTISYEPDTGVLTITPAQLKAYEGGSNQPASAQAYVPTSVYLIK